MTDFPKAPPEKDESRYIACQMAVETVLQDLVEDAMCRGWEETEVLSASMRLRTTSCWRRLPSGI